MDLGMEPILGFVKCNLFTLEMEVGEWRYPVDKNGGRNFCKMNSLGPSDKKRPT